MTAMRRLRILERLTDGAGISASRLCSVSADLTGMTGAGVMLMSEDIPQGSLCSSDVVAARIEQLQYELGEGPCIDAFHLDHPVREPDLAAVAADRWIAFSPPAVTAGVRAVFGFPLRIGTVRLGALDLYRSDPGPMTDDQHGEALVLADVVAETILALQADAPPGELAGHLRAVADTHSVVHQASGMVAVQLGVGLGTALVRLRAHAFGDGRPLEAVARDIVRRVLRLEADHDGQRPHDRRADDSP